MTTPLLGTGRPDPAPPRGHKRDAIVRAAIREFARRGFFGAQVADVARTAGVAAGTVYLYFRSKDDLLITIFEQTMRQAIEEGRKIISTLDSPVEQLRAIARLHLERLERDLDLAIVFQVELRHSTKHMERCSETQLREYLTLIRDTVVHGQTRGLFRANIDAMTAAKVLFGALDEMATNWILSRRHSSLASVADDVVDLFVGGIGRTAPV